VDDESKITIDVVVCGSPPTPTSKWAPGNDAIADYMYARNIHSFYSNADNLAEEKSAYPNINWRYLFQQSENQLSGLAELTFDNANTWPLQENGRQVAMTTLQAGEGTVFKYLEEYHASQDLKKKHGHWLNYMNSKLRA